MGETYQEELTTEELIRLFIADRLLDLHVSFPVKVDSFSASAQTVDCTPQLKRHLPDGSGNFIPERLPKLSAIPVGFMRGGGFFASFPIAVGDYGMVVCSEKSLSVWRATGDLVDPGDVATHTLDGAWFLPCVAPDSKALSSASGSNMVIGRDGATAAQVEITPSMVKLGGGDQFVALANKVLTELNSIKSSFDGHTHPYVNGVAGATTSAPTNPMAAPSSVAASNVKAT